LIGLRLSTFSVNKKRVSEKEKEKEKEKTQKGKPEPQQPMEGTTPPKPPPRGRW